MSTLKVNAIRSTSASSDAITLDGSGNITLPGNLTVTGTNNIDTDIRKDLATLALQSAVDTNRKAYNLQNSFIDQFEDETGISSKTTCGREVDEFCASVFNDTTYFAPPLLEVAHGNANITPATSSWTGGGVTNDSYPIKWNNTSPNWYSSVGVNELWDLGNDFTFRLFFNTSAGEISSGRGHNSISFILTADTGKAAGSNPSDVWATPALSANEIDGSPSFDNWFVNPYANSSNSDFGAIDNAPDHNNADSSAATERNLTYSNLGSGGGVYSFRHYWLTAQAGNTSGIQVEYTKSTSTMTFKQLNGSDRSAVLTNNIVTLSSVPAAGRCLFIIGQADGQTSTDVYATTYKDGSTSNYSSKVALSNNAAGTLVGTANTASSSRTKGSGVMLYKNGAGTATIGTDLKIYFTCNGGSNWTEAASYTAGADFSTGIKTIHLGETTCTAGTDVRYKAVWANQANGSKVTELHGIAVNY